MRVIIGCEESQTVCKAFRDRGHEAFSCDTEPCSGGYPEWHFQESIFDVLGRERNFDLGIFHPPCTHLAVSGAVHFAKKLLDGRQKEGIDFFLRLTQCKIGRTAIENPVGIMSRIYKKPTQIIQPYYFGDEAQKTTCLWLKNLPKLKYTNIVGKGEMYQSSNGKKMPLWCAFPRDGDGKSLGWASKEIKALRSKTFQGIANAMAEQWGSLPLNYVKEGQQLYLFK